MDGFGGTIGRDWSESTPWWPEPARPAPGTPNVLLVLLDDVGFAQLGCFGSDIATPNFDRLAAAGLRYTNFHTTALCSPTRACLLTGRNHHSNGMGRITELATGFPGYHGRIPKANGFLSEMLTPAGFAAYAVGKWHLTPEEEGHLGASRDRWPLGRGFERYYGFFGGETHQFAPALVHDNHFVEPPGSYEDGYHFTADMTDRATAWLQDLRAVDPAKPFFLYYATGACHSPHHAPPEWIERYRGRFDDGWDVWREQTLRRQIRGGVLAEGTRLSPRPAWVPAWDDLPADAQRVYARYMEAFAGMLSHTDAQVGRLLDALARWGELDNTVVVVASDNGASSEGGPEGSLNDVRQWNLVPRTWQEAVERIDEIGGPEVHNNYPWGWTVAGNTPFRRWKRETHEGGVADPLIVHWPAGIERPGETRRQYVHAIDVLPTVLEVLGLEAPAEIGGVAQRPIEGTSFAYTFDEPDAPERHVTQYYEMFGSRAIYHRGWKAVTYSPMMAPDPMWDDDAWELYDLREDPTELDDLAVAHPEKVAELAQRWWMEAARHQVLPLDNRPLSDMVLDRPKGFPDRDEWVYEPGSGMVPEAAAVDVKNRSHRVRAHVEVADGDPAPEGVLIAQGSRLGGWTFFVADGRLTYAHNLSGQTEHRVSAPLGLAPGAHVLELRFDKTGEHQGVARLLLDGDQLAEGPIPAFTPIRFSLVGHGLTCGYDGVFAVVKDYAAPFPFTRGLRRVTVSVDGPRYLDPEGEAQAAVATQ